MILVRTIMQVSNYVVGEDCKRLHVPKANRVGLWSIIYISILEHITLVVTSIFGTICEQGAFKIKQPAISNIEHYMTLTQLLEQIYIWQWVKSSLPVLIQAVRIARLLALNYISMLFNHQNNNYNMSASLIIIFAKFSIVLSITCSKKTKTVFDHFTSCLNAIKFNLNKKLSSFDKPWKQQITCQVHTG